MVTDLVHHIQITPMADTHEHLYTEAHYVDDGPDILEDLFAKNYIVADLVVAGATPEAAERLRDSHDPDLEARWNGVKDAWQYCQHTGYGQAVRLIARHVYGMDEITLPALLAARERNLQLRLPGERLRILKQEGNLDHVQIDNLDWECLPDESGPDFFLYDLSWRTLSSGEIDVARIRQTFGIEIANVAHLREAMAAIFQKWGPYAIAVKSQHAYDRTLLWQERTDEDANRVLQKSLSGQAITPEEKLCLGDWCLSRGIELAIQHHLPFKLHTGYYGRVNRLVMERIHPGHLCTLLMRYPEARFVLMHTGYPYMDETIAVAKHFPNTCVDMCWAWSIDPLAASQFVRRIIHTVPTNKLFAFGGDTLWPNAAVSYARQAREWLTRTLQAAVDEGDVSEREAITLASRFMHLNQKDCFDLDGTRAAIHAAINKERPT
jgi:hypothetical protein